MSGTKLSLLLTWFNKRAKWKRKWKCLVSCQCHVLADHLLVLSGPLPVSKINKQIVGKTFFKKTESIEKPINDFSSNLRTFSINNQSIYHNSLSALVSSKVHTKQISQVLNRPYIYLFFKFGLNSHEKSNLLGNRSCKTSTKGFSFYHFVLRILLKLRFGSASMASLATTLDAAVDRNTSKW